MTDLTRDSKASVLARVERDPEFALALFDELAQMTRENERLRAENAELRQKLYSEKAFYRALEMQCENAWKQVKQLRRKYGDDNELTDGGL